MKHGYTITEKQSRILENIRFAAADVARCREKYGMYDPETLAAEKNLDSWLDDCDYYHVPAPLVNHAIAYASEWRRYASGKITFDAWLQAERLTVYTVAKEAA